MEERYTEMNREYGTVSFERTLGLLTVRQYLYPHEPLGEALVQALGDGAYDSALAAERVDGAAAIGRLPRKDLLRLARRLADRAQVSPGGDLKQLVA